MFDTSMITSLLLAVLGLMVFVFVARSIDRWNAARTLRAISDDGRSIKASNAITLYESGFGMLFRNRSSLPGEWWLLRKEDQRVNYDLFTNLREFGFVVECESSEDRKLINSYLGKVEEVLEPFD